MIYKMQEKDKLNLMNYNVKMEQGKSFIPSSPFSFILEENG